MKVNLNTLENLERRELRERKAISQSRAIRRQRHASRRAARAAKGCPVSFIPVAVTVWEPLPAGLSTTEWLALPGSEDTL